MEGELGGPERPCGAAFCISRGASSRLADAKRPAARLQGFDAQNLQPASGREMGDVHTGQRVVSEQPDDPPGAQALQRAPQPQGWHRASVAAGVDLDLGRQ